MRSVSSADPCRTYSVPSGSPMWQASSSVQGAEATTQPWPRIPFSPSSGPSAVSWARFAFSRGGRRRRGRDGRRAFRVEFQDVAAVDPEPEERFLRLAVLAEDGVAGRAFERLAEVGEGGPQILARLRPALLEHALEDARRVE